MLKAPSRQSPIPWADWLELLALTRPDASSSANDVSKVLRQQAGSNEKADFEIEQFGISVFHELSLRAKAARDGYPFTVDTATGLINSKEWKRVPAYVFCLCLTQFPPKEKKGSKSKPRQWFEYLSRDAAISYLGGDGVRFGFPRDARELPTNFKLAVEKLSKDKLGEGDGFANRGRPRRKDDLLDVVAWKHFPDGLPGKLILFGNCGTELDWETSGKMRELQPIEFTNNWILNPLRVPIIKSFFTPHRTSVSDFIICVGTAHILFDRCRISHWTANAAARGSTFDYDQITAWCEDQLQPLKGELAK